VNRLDKRLTVRLTGYRVSVTFMPLCSINVRFAVASLLLCAPFRKRAFARTSDTISRCRVAQTIMTPEARATPINVVLCSHGGNGASQRRERYTHHAAGRISGAVGSSPRLNRTVALGNP
jgi:hypothetical protein